MGTPNICSFPLDVARKPPVFRMLGVGDSPTPNICSSRRTTDVRGTENGTPNISSTGPKSVPHGEQQMFGVRNQRTGRTPNICPSSRRAADFRGPEPKDGPNPKHVFLMANSNCSGSGTKGRADPQTSVLHGEQQMFGARNPGAGQSPNICSLTLSESNRCLGSGAPSPKHLPSLSVPLI